MSRSIPKALIHPPGYDAVLVRRIEQQRYRIGHGLAKLIESYWAACVLGRTRKAAACETELRQRLNREERKTA